MKYARPKSLYQGLVAAYGPRDILRILLHLRAEGGQAGQPLLSLGDEALHDAAQNPQSLAQLLQTLCVRWADDGPGAWVGLRDAIETLELALTEDLLASLAASEGVDGPEEDWEEEATYVIGLGLPSEDRVPGEMSGSAAPVREGGEVEGLAHSNGAVGILGADEAHVDGEALIPAETDGAGREAEAGGGASMSSHPANPGVGLPKGAGCPEGAAWVPAGPNAGSGAQAFALSVSPITHTEFQHFLDATAYVPTQAVDYLRQAVEGRLPDVLGAHPVVYVSHEDASAYANWAGGRLPTRVEWRRALAGDDGRPRPWGSEASTGRTNSREARMGWTTPGGAFPTGKGPFAHEDLLGNVWEWLAVEEDPLFAPIAGGSWVNGTSSLDRGWFSRAVCCTRHFFIGFRVLWPGVGEAE